LDVVTVADERLLSQLDPVVARAAREEGRVLLTADVEFADLRKCRPGNHPGVVLFRPRRRSIRVFRETVIAFASAVQWEMVRGCVVVVTDAERIRVRTP
jgi:predicted nuclease of predicted toxin-antitoxin system